MKRLFLNSTARASLLTTGKATVRTRIKQAHEDGIAYAVHPARESGWIAWYGRPSLGTAEFTLKEYRHGFPCPTPEGAEYWVPEPWCPAADGSGMTQWSEDGNTYKVYYEADDREHDVIHLDDDGFQKWNKDGTAANPWESSAKMPRWAARLFVRVAAVRVVQQRVEKPLGEWQYDWVWQTDLERIENV